MRTRILFSIIFAISTVTVQAQGTISGVVTANGQGLEFVNIRVLHTELGTFTDPNGLFEISQLPLGKHTVYFSFIGYETQSKTITLTATQPLVNIKIDLTATANPLEEVVVSGALKEVKKMDSPIPVEVYSAQFFKTNPAPSMFESMQNVNGVRPQLNCNVCNTGDIHINGLEGPYTMVLIDGMPIVSGLSTVYGLTGIPQNLVERIEIVKGPAATLYGSEAVGGLINVITKDAIGAPLIAADFFATDWGEFTADVGASFKSGKHFQSLLGINYFNYQNPIDKNGDGFTDLTLQDRISVFNKWQMRRKNQREFSFAGRYIYEDRWGGEMHWTPYYRGGNKVYGESIYTERWELFGVYQLPIKEIVKLRISANSHAQNSVYGEMAYIADQKIGFGQLTWEKNLNLKHDLLSGLAYRYTYYDDNTTATAKEIANTNAPSVTHLPGAFVQDNWTIDSQNNLLMGLRYDINSLHGNIFTPRLNYKWSSKNNNNIIRLGLGNGYRVANVFTEDHAALTGARTVVFASELKPEKSWNANLNWVKNIYPKNMAYALIDASIWYTHFNNRIVPDYETHVNQIIYDNLDGFAVSQGVSINVDGAWKNGLKARIGATLMDVKIHENGISSRQLLTENFTATWNIGYRIARWNLKLDYTGNVYSPMRLPLLGGLDPRPEYSPWFSIQNIQITKAINSRWEIYGGIKNLLNYTPPSNSIARAHDPFDKNVQFNNQGEVIPTSNNPHALTFDPSYVFTSNQGIRGFLGIRYTLRPLTTPR